MYALSGLICIMSEAFPYRVHPYIYMAICLSLGFDHHSENRSKFFKTASRWQKAVKKVLEDESGKRLCKPADFLNEEVKMIDQSQRQMQLSTQMQPRVEWIECDDVQVREIIK